MNQLEFEQIANSRRIRLYDEMLSAEIAPHVLGETKLDFLISIGPIFDRETMLIGRNLNPRDHANTIQPSWRN